MLATRRVPVSLRSKRPHFNPSSPPTFLTGTYSTIRASSLIRSSPPNDSTGNVNATRSPKSHLTRHYARSTAKQPSKSQPSQPNARPQNKTNDGSPENFSRTQAKDTAAGSSRHISRLTAANVKVKHTIPPKKSLRKKLQLKDEAYLRQTLRIPTSADLPDCPKALFQDTRVFLIQTLQNIVSFDAKFTEIEHRANRCDLTYLTASHKIDASGEGASKVCTIYHLSS